MRVKRMQAKGVLIGILFSYTVQSNNIENHSDIVTGLISRSVAQVQG